MVLGMEVGLSPGDFVLDGDPVLPPLKGHSPQFSANVRCGQTAGWTKMPLGMESKKVLQKVLQVCFNDLKSYFSC